MTILDQYSIKYFPNFQYNFCVCKKKRKSYEIWGQLFTNVQLAEISQKFQIQETKRSEKERKDLTHFSLTFFHNQTLPNTSPKFSIYQCTIFGHLTKNFMFLEHLKTCVYVNMDKQMNRYVYL